MIRRKVAAPPSFLRAIFKPFLASAIMAAGAWGSYGLLHNYVGLGNSLSTLGGIGIAVVIYAILVLALRAISKDDLALMPKGEKIAKILRIS